MCSLGTHNKSGMESSGNAQSSDGETGTLGAEQAPQGQEQRSGGPCFERSMGAGCRRKPSNSGGLSRGRGSLEPAGQGLPGTGSYDEARDAFERASHLAPYNAISKKNLERISHLRETAPSPGAGAQARKAGKAFMPYMFIEESGKAGVTTANRTAPGAVLAKLASGDSVKLVTRDHAVIVENGQGEYLGRIEPKLSKRLIRLIDRRQ